MSSLALQSSASGMFAQQTNVDVHSHNIANLSTPGYHRQRAGFMDLFYQTQKRAGFNASVDGTMVPSAIQVGLGTNIGTIYTIPEQGAPLITSSETDMMINGRGYFRLTDPNNNVFYTRDGSFTIDPNSKQLVTAKGLVLDPGLAIPDNTSDIQISETGVVNAFIEGQIAPSNIGQIQLAIFVNENGLDKLGDNLFQATAASGPEVTGNPGTDLFGTIRQGMLESSNVQAVIEMTELVKAQRAYEMCANVMHMASEMEGVVNKVVAS